MNPSIKFHYIIIPKVRIKFLFNYHTQQKCRNQIGIGRTRKKKSYQLCAMLFGGDPGIQVISAMVCDYSVCLI